jgi:hypothetical protein
MEIDEFIETVDRKIKPDNLSLELQTLWFAAAGDWENAHQLIQDEPGADAALLHAYLHRVEGDAGNAAYWYRRAGETLPKLAFEEEWKLLVARFLKK